MNVRSAVLASLLALPSILGPTMWAQSQPEPDNGRKVVRKVQPKYPAMARRINLTGTVKLVAEVASDGTVKKVDPVGGSPVLMQAAESAIYQWKFAAGAESKETVEFHFTPE